MRLDGDRVIYWPSELDEFRLFLSGVQWNGEDEYTPEDFVRKMTTHEEADAQAAGTALHNAFENATYGQDYDRLEQDGWKIAFDLHAEVTLPRLREIKLTREHQGIILHCRCDHIDAITVHDIKTAKSIDIDAYTESYQWRAYLWMSGRRNFVYDIFHVTRDEKRREMVVKEYVRLPLTTYPRLSADVESLLVEFDAAVKALGIPEIMAKRSVAA